MGLVIIALIIFLVNANDNAIFSLTWMAGHCQNLGSSCDRIKYEQWDHQSFTVHGLWPSQKSYRDFGDFNFQLLKKSLLEDMYNYWPPQPKTGGLPHFLWEFQWEKHGNSYSQLILEAMPYHFSSNTKTRNEELQVYYFIKVIQLYKTLNVKRVPQRQYTQDEFSALTKIPTRSLYFVCSEFGTFLEVRICLRIKDMSYRSCYKTDSNCPGGYALLKDWRDNNIAIKDKQSDSQVARVKGKDGPSIYVPIAQRKEDEKIELIVSATNQAGEESSAVNSLSDSIVIIGVQTEKHKQQERGDVVKSQKELQKQIKEEILEEIQMEQLEELALEHLDQEKTLQDMDGDGPVSQAKVVQIVEIYMFLTAVLVSIFWIAIFCLCLCIFRKNKQQPLKEEVQDEIKTQDFSNQQIK